jgi:hypothetical protein
MAERPAKAPCGGTRGRLLGIIKVILTTVYLLSRFYPLVKSIEVKESKMATGPLLLSSVVSTTSTCVVTYYKMVDSCDGAPEKIVIT